MGSELTPLPLGGSLRSSWVERRKEAGASRAQIVAGCSDVGGFFSSLIRRSFSFPIPPSTFFFLKRFGEELLIFCLLFHCLSQECTVFFSVCKCCSCLCVFCSVFFLLSWSPFGAFFSFFCFCGGAFSFLFLMALPILGRNGGGGL